MALVGVGAILINLGEGSPVLQHLLEIEVLLKGVVGHPLHPANIGHLFWICQPRRHAGLVGLGRVNARRGAPPFVILLLCGGGCLIIFTTIIIGWLLQLILSD